MKYLHPIPELKGLMSKHSAELLRLVLLAREESHRTDAYRSWEEIRYHFGPEHISSEEWWLGIKLNRMQSRQEIPLASPRGQFFSYAPNNMVMKHLHLIDSMAGGTLSSSFSAELTRDNRKSYLVNSLVEESIMSSILEGASVTRADAKAMLREKRRPGDRGERMIANNYRTMQQIIAWKDEELTPARLLELHRLMSEGTLDSPEREGQWRRAGDNVRVEEENSGDIIHVPPPADRLPQLMQELCDFANCEEGSFYLHPVLKAIILHFWLAYLHPFVDGNGRTARALFYWVMLRHGFWLFEYITISNEIRKKKNGRSYYEAFINTERDDEDLNYFICDQLLTIVRAIESFYGYIKRKRAEQDALFLQVRGMRDLNARQRQLLGSMLKDSEQVMSFDAYAQAYGVVRQTARTDLLGLVEKGYLCSSKRGRAYYFTAVPGLAQLLQEKR